MRVRDQRGVDGTLVVGVGETMDQGEVTKDGETTGQGEGTKESGTMGKGEGIMGRLQEVDVAMMVQQIEEDDAMMDQGDGMMGLRQEEGAAMDDVMMDHHQEVGVEIVVGEAGAAATRVDLGVVAVEVF